MTLVARASNWLRWNANVCGLLSWLDECVVHIYLWPCQLNDISIYLLIFEPPPPHIYFKTILTRTMRATESNKQTKKNTQTN